MLCSKTLIGEGVLSIKIIKARGKYVFIKSRSIHTPGSIAMSYASFNGFYGILLHLDETEVVHLTIAVTSEAGELNVSINDANGISYLNKIAVPSSGFDFKINKPGDYNITLNADHHKGGFKITLEREA